MLAYSTRLGCPRVVLLYPQQAGAQSTRLEYEIKSQSQYVCSCCWLFENSLI
jgi:hypothetical protein